MGLTTGDVQVREQAPWALDATNDLPKSHPLYLAAAGLVTNVNATWTDLAADGLGLGYTNAVTIPTGKTGYILDFALSSNGIFLGELNIDGVGWFKMWTPAGGGLVSLPLNGPIAVPAGDTCGFTTQNKDSAAKNGAAYLAVAIL